MTLPEKFKFKHGITENILYTATKVGADRYHISWDTDPDGLGLRYAAQHVHDSVEHGVWIIQEQTQAQKNGWPEWDKLPDEFLMYPGAGVCSAYLYKRVDSENFICKFLNHRGNNNDHQTTLSKIKDFGSRDGGWTYQGPHAYDAPVKEKSEAEFHIEEAIRYHESQIEHHNLMIGKYKEKLGG